MAPGVVTYLVNWADERGRAGELAAGWLRDVSGVLCLTSGMTPTLMYDWLSVLGGAPDDADVNALLALLTPLWGDRGDPVLKKTREQWMSVGAAGPYAYAAGVPVAEALARGPELADEVDGLRTLAGLRGWMFPPKSYDMHL